ncbi:hypothetical protein DSO57_1038966 [Entomophthora muscae]|uniref:Uncharacterized protein n=1 Tax=Entomophthora muscae TaxID=34485 RepID=A0ACC2S0L4_9FUNG|nr:hypothetical protein DSO57_1038966 [Entomophthora muscae]
MSVSPAPVSGLVSSSLVPTASASVAAFVSVLSTPAHTVPSSLNQSTNNSEHCLEMKELNPSKHQTLTDVMIENITTQEAENNHQSVDHNTLPNYAIAAPQCNSLLVMEVNQSAPSDLPIMRMRPDATDLVSSQVPSQDSLSQSTVTTLIDFHAQAQCHSPYQSPAELPQGRQDGHEWPCTQFVLF